MMEDGELQNERLEVSANTKENVEKTYTDPITGKFIPGNPGGGRPKGSFSIKEAVRRKLQENPGLFEEFVSYFAKDNRELTWQMLEGKPSQDLNVGGELRTVELKRGTVGLVPESVSSVASDSNTGLEQKSV